MEPGTFWVYPVGCAGNGTSSDQPLSILHPAAVWLGRACETELVRPEVGSGNVEAAGTCPGTHKNDFPTHKPQAVARTILWAQRQIKPALRGAAPDTLILMFKAQLQVQVSVPPHWTLKAPASASSPKLDTPSDPPNARTAPAHTQSAS